jgi:hypothetical protein
VHWVWGEWLCPGSPDFADVFVELEATKGLEQMRQVVGCQDLREVRLRMFTSVVMVELEPLPSLFVALDIRQARATVPLQTLMQGWPCQIRNQGL